MPRVKYTAEGQEHIINVGEDVYCDNKIAVRHGGKTYYAGLVEPPSNEKTLALLHFDDSPTFDECFDTWSLATTATTVTTSTSKFGTGSLYGSLVSNDTFPLGAGDFTVDFWVKAGSGSNCIFFALQETLGDANNNDFHIPAEDSSGATTFYLMFHDTSGSQVSVGTSIKLTSNTFGHVAIVYVYSEKKALAFTNGFLGATLTGLDIPLANRYCVINGQYHNGSLGWNFANAYYDEFRISNVARWTANFTPPTAPYTVD